MGLRPLAVASCCLLALTSMACEKVPRELFPKEEVPWSRNILAAEIRLPGVEQAAISQLSEILARAGSVPGVEAVAVVDAIPGITDGRKFRYATAREGAPPGASIASFVQSISPGYFAVMRISLLRGRPFTEADQESSAPVAIISETYAKQGWPDEDPLGKRLRLPSGWGNGTWVEIVGIVKDGPAAEGVPEVYVPYTQYSLHGRAAQVFSWFLLARPMGDPEAVAAELKRIVRHEFWSLEAWQEKRSPA